MIRQIEKGDTKRGIIILKDKFKEFAEVSEEVGGRVDMTVQIGVIEDFYIEKA